jgi:WD40 repeat protein
LDTQEGSGVLSLMALLLSVAQRTELFGFGMQTREPVTMFYKDILQQLVVSGSRDSTLRVWNIETGECTETLSGHVAAVRCVQYDGCRVVSGAYDYLVRVWDPVEGQCLHILQGHTNRVYSLQFDGVHIVSGSLDTSIRVWNADSGRCIHTLTGISLVVEL